ncbi:hypothetical protein OSB04_007567 [Centaurea solstitialis]|uniref:Uncharacterized protein n=1 Tax=Centaurea solstitialis TaxID=347529 RepID=A0AA38U3B5_9ASTR|nr:hypothetical protein OSB04_007567 [Centaurea solstitialis]
MRTGTGTTHIGSGSGTGGSIAVPVPKADMKQILFRNAGYGGRIVVCSQGTTAETFDELPDNTCLKIIAGKTVRREEEEEERAFSYFGSVRVTSIRVRFGSCFVSTHFATGGTTAETVNELPDNTCLKIIAGKTTDMVVNRGGETRGADCGTDGGGGGGFFTTFGRRHHHHCPPSSY